MIEPLHLPLAARRRTRFRESLNVQVKMKSTLRALPLFSFFSSHFWLFSRMKLRNCCGWATAATSGPQYFSMQHAAQMERWISSWLQSLANESKSNTFQLMSWEQNEIRLPAAVVQGICTSSSLPICRENNFICLSSFCFDFRYSQSMHPVGPCSPKKNVPLRNVKKQSKDKRNLHI